MKCKHKNAIPFEAEKELAENVPVHIVLDDKLQRVWAWCPNCGALEITSGWLTVVRRR